jgi:hypothetical protein
MEGLDVIAAAALQPAAQSIADICAAPRMHAAQNLLLAPPKINSDRGIRGDWRAARAKAGGVQRRAQPRLLPLGGPDDQ